MLSKFLLTLTVIIAAFLVLRHRKLSSPAAAAKPRSGVDADKASKASNILPKDDSLSSDMRAAAYMFLVLMVGLGASLYYFRWQDAHHILTISLHRDNQSAPVIYQVYKFQLQDRSFVTIDGTVVNVASSERMEVAGLID